MNGQAEINRRATQMRDDKIRAAHNGWKWNKPIRPPTFLQRARRAWQVLIGSNEELNKFSEQSQAYIRLKVITLGLRRDLIIEGLITKDAPLDPSELVFHVIDVMNKRHRGLMESLKKARANRSEQRRGVQTDDGVGGNEEEII